MEKAVQVMNEYIDSGKNPSLSLFVVSEISWINPITFIFSTIHKIVGN